MDWKEIDLDNLEEKKEEVKKIDKVSVEEDTVLEKDDEKTNEESTEDSKQKEYSRSQNRIRYLANQRKALARENQELKTKLQTEIDSLKAKLAEVTVGSAQYETFSKISDTKNSIERLRKELVEAHKESNYEKIASITSDLQRETVNLQILEAKKQIREETGQKTEQNTAQRTTNTEEEGELPDSFLDWSDENPWFTEPENKDERKLKRRVRQLAKELTEEGFSVAEPDFYDELNDRIEEVVKKEKLSVRGKEPPKEEVKPKTAPHASAKREASGGVTRTSDGRFKVRLTAEEREMARRLNVSEEDYAKQKIDMNKKDTSHMIEVVF